MKKIIIVLCACFFMLQCGYHLRGTGSSLPDYIKKIYVPMFKNRTTRFELDRKLTQSVIDELVARSKMEITGDLESADAVLIGEIIGFQVHPIAVSNQATADRFNVTVTAKIILRDLKKKKVIFSHPYFPYVTDYEVPEGSDFEAVETEAIDEIAEKFARSLVISILEGF